MNAKIVLKKSGASASARRKIHRRWSERIESKDGQPSVVVNWSDHLSIIISPFENICKKKYYLKNRIHIPNLFLNISIRTYLPRQSTFSKAGFSTESASIRPIFANTSHGIGTIQIQWFQIGTPYPSHIFSWSEKYRFCA
jgi:hypothetical protein